MAIITYENVQIDPNDDTFLNWLTLTNSLISDMGSTVISVGSNNNGNVSLNGHFRANTSSFDTISGGTLADPSDLTITSNTNITGNVFSLSANTDFIANRNASFNGVSHTLTIDTAEVIITSPSFQSSSNTVFNGPVESTTTLTANNLIITGELDVQSLQISSDTVFEVLEVTTQFTATEGDFNNISANTGIIKDISANNIIVSSNTDTNILNADQANITSANTIAISTISISANTGNVSSLSSNTASFSTLTANNASIGTLSVTGTGALKLPSGTTSQRPVSSIPGMIRYNAETGKYEGFYSTEWKDLITQFDDPLENLSSGFLVKTGATTYASRSLVAGTGVNITNTSGIASNPTISLNFGTVANLRSGATGVAIQPSTVYQADAPVQVNIGTSSITLNFNAGRTFEMLLTGNRTVNTPQNLKPGQKGIIIVKQDLAANRILQFSNVWKFAGGSPVLSRNSNDVDIISYFVADSSNIYCTIVRGFR